MSNETPKKHILNNGGKHDGEPCTYTMCYSNDSSVKDKCLGWCRPGSTPLVEKPDFKQWLKKKIGPINYMKGFPNHYSEIEVVTFANEYANEYYLPVKEENERLKKSGWISVKERLPEDMQEVLFCNNDIKDWNGNPVKTTAHCGYFVSRDNGSFYSWLDMMDRFKPTHWQPLPNPPGERKEEKMK